MSKNMIRANFHTLKCSKIDLQTEFGMISRPFRLKKTRPDRQNHQNYPKIPKLDPNRPENFPEYDPRPTRFGHLRVGGRAKPFNKSTRSACQPSYEKLIWGIAKTRTTPFPWYYSGRTKGIIRSVRSPARRAVRPSARPPVRPSVRSSVRPSAPSVRPSSLRSAPLRCAPLRSAPLRPPRPSVRPKKKNWKNVEKQSYHFDDPKRESWAKICFLDFGRNLEVILDVFWMPNRGQNRSCENMKHLCFTYVKQGVRGVFWATTSMKKRRQKRISFWDSLLIDGGRFLEPFLEQAQPKIR